MMQCTRNMLAALTLLGINTPMAMETEQPNHFKGVAKVTETLATSVLNVSSDKNTISCALGPVQILATLHQALADNEITKKLEIETLLGHGITANGLKEFNALIANETTDTSVFLNNQYIFPFNKGVNEDAVQFISDLGSTVVPLDFEDNKGAAEKINAIVKSDTKGHIQDLAQANQFSDLTRAVLLSTLYIKAKWGPNFYDLTLPFKTLNKKKSVAGFGGNGNMWYRETANEHFLAIPAANKIYLMIKMSKEDDKVSPITSAEWDAEQTQEFMTLKMPNFTIENTLNLTDYLKETLPTVLDPEDQFQTTLTDLPLFVSSFLQKNKIVVNKDGLEAASATHMGLNARCLPERKVVIDRPFSYLLCKGYGKNSGGGSKNFLFLFSGTVMDPTQNL